MTGRPASDRPSRPQASDPSAEFLGPYRLIEILGEGGMGTVWRAEQSEPVRRSVALKLVRSDLDGADVFARFETELQALACMTHPNVAQIFDAGRSDDGRPYIAMEYVPGLPITEFCDRRELGVDDRLRLFVEVCRGVHHAHQKGILHRDLKPSNVLVALVDDRPVPKIIDFGVAKAMQPFLGSRELAERGRFIGTPAYMSPEQAEITALGIDSRTDVYSLGVLLHELLVGEVPFDPRSLKPGEIGDLPQKLRERTPSKPSTRCKLADPSFARRAQARGATPRRLARRLRGDLDWIVLRALQKDPERRYASASEFALDLQRHLGGRPVSAGPASPGYRTLKFFGRNRVPAIAAAIVLASLVGGLVAALLQSARARESAEVARRSAELAEKSAEEARSSLARAQAAESDARAALDRERAALAEATGRRLAAQAQSLVGESPTLALLLAIEGAERAPGPESSAALYAALDRHREVSLWDGHDATARARELSHDGSLFASGDESGLVLLRDARTGAIRWRAEVDSRNVSAVGFSTDDGTVWATSDGGIAVAWRASDGEEQQRFVHPAKIESAATLPASNLLITSCEDGRVRAWDLAKGGDALLVAEHESGYCPWISVSDGGLRVASIGRASDVQVRDLTTPGAAPLRVELTSGEPPAHYDVDHRIHASVELSKDGARLLARSRDGQVLLIDAVTGRAIVRFTKPNEFTGTPALSPDGERVFLPWWNVDEEPRAEILDALTGQTLVRFSGALFPEAMSADFSPDGGTLVVSGHEWLDVWDAATGASRGKLVGSAHGMSRPRFRADGREVLTTGHDGLTRVFRISAMRQEWRLAELAARGELAELQTAPDGEQSVVARSADPDALELVDAPSGRRLLELLPPKPGAKQAVFGARGEKLAIAGEFGLRVWDLAARRVLFEREGKCELPCFSPGGAWVSVLRPTGIEVHEVATGRLSANVVAARAAAFRAQPSPDGRLLVTADGAANSVSLWDAASGELLHRYRHAGFAFCARFDPSGGRVLSFANDTSAQIFDVARRAVVRRVDRLPTTGYGTVDWSPDGGEASVASDEDVFLLDAAAGTVKARWTIPHPRSPLDFAVFTPDGRNLLARIAPTVTCFLPLDPLAYARSMAPRKLSASEMATFDLGTPEEREARAREIEDGLTSTARLVRLAQGRIDGGDADRALELLRRAASIRREPGGNYRICLARSLARHAAAQPDGANGRARREAEEKAALESLRAGVEQRTISKVMLLELPELEALRGRPEFRELVERAGS